jgi:spermidine/putrescine transport system substrate-binding protein
MPSRPPLRACLRAAVVILGVALAPSAAADPAREVLLLNWSEYLDPELLAAFEAEHGIRVREVYYESDDARDEILVRSDGRGFDLAIVNGSNMDAYRRRGWLHPVTPAEVPNLRHIDPAWLSPFPAAEGYAAPYFWGTLGIAWRSDLVGEPIHSWMQILDPSDEALRGKIVMHSSTRDLIGMALRALGHSVSTTDPEALRAAEDLLIRQRPNVHSYGYVSLDEGSSMVSGEAVAAMLFNGDALMLQEVEPRIEFVVPEEGCNLWVDYLVVLADAPNKDLALRFMDFLNEPERAAALAEYVWYATPNRAAADLLSEEFKSDPVIYPDADVLARCETYEALPPRVRRSYNAVYSRVVN